nr:TonB-dependent receptor [Hyphomonadaceae bacterium]
RIRTRIEQAISPVQVISAQQLRENGNVDIDQVLREQPAFAPTIGQTTSPALQESHGASTIDMRGLGQNRSLVLVNGQRATPNGFRNSVDINTIPSALIERVEYLTGGAAAVYGADAVAGVTNFILRDNFEGGDITFTGSVAEEGDAESYTIGGTFGRNFLDDRLNLTGHVSYTERGKLERADRDWAAVEVDDTGNPRLNIAQPAGGIFTINCTGFATGAALNACNARRFNLTSLGGPPSNNAIAFREDGTVTVPPLSTNQSRFGAFINPSERVNVALFGKFTISPMFELYGRYQDAAIMSESQNVPVAVSVGFPLATPVLIRRDNPYLTPALLAVFNPVFNRNLDGTPGGTDAVLMTVSRTLTELGPRIDETERTMTQTVFGLRGELGGGVRYDIVRIDGENTEVVTRFNAGLAARVPQAANARLVNGVAQCVDTSNGCVPANLFGPNSLSPEAAAWIAADPFNFNTRVREQSVASATFSGDTIGLFEAPGGPIGWAIGIERRKEFASTDFGPPAKLGLTLHAAGPRLAQAVNYSLDEMFAEIKVPLLADLPFIRTLEVEGAYRLTDHSQAGDYDTSKVGFNWAINDSFRIRGSQQTIVRGANPGELFNLINFPALPTTTLDPCADVAAPQATLAICDAAGAPAPGYSPNILNAITPQGGDPNILPETGETTTFGFVLAPRALPGLSIIVDRYDITLDNAISGVSAVERLNFCYNIFRDLDSPICKSISRDPVTGLITQIITNDTNIALFEVGGYDISINYNARMPRGLPGDRVTIGYTANIVDSFKRQLNPLAPVVDCAGFFGSQATSCSESGLGARAVPEYRHILNLAWTGGPLTLRGTWRNMGQTDNLTPNAFRVQHLDIYDLFDLGVSYRFNDALRGSLTVSNVFDTDPPLMGSQQAYANTFPNQYDIIGRRFTMNLTYRFR